jgi:PilZ domain
MHLRRENSMQHPAPERRTMRRFDMRLPASVRVAGNGLRDLMTETQNVSARGVFFYLDRPLAEGARIEVTMTFPPHVTLTEPVRVRFTARVVRVEDSHSVSNIGVAAMIEEYEFLRSNGATEFNGLR